MVRYAEWRKPHDPHRPLSRYDDPLLILGTLGTTLVGLYCCCGIGAIPGLICGWGYFSNLQTRRRLERLRDEPTRYPQHACRLTLRFGDTPYGRDEGLVSFVDGFLVFEGRQATFSLPRNGFSTSVYDPQGFLFPTPVGRCGASITPLASKEFLPELAEWLSGTVAEAAVVVLPPTTPHPWAWRRAARLALSGWLAAIAGVGVALYFAIRGNFVFTLVAASCTVILAVSILQTASERWKALTRLQESGERPNA